MARGGKVDILEEEVKMLRKGVLFNISSDKYGE